MTIALLSIGTELTRGELNNTNVYWLSDELTSLGHTVTEIVTVDDDDTRIIAAIQRLMSTHESVLCTGGLGPTTDDRTTACAARAFGLPLVRDAASLSHIKELFSAHAYEMTPSNEKQADFPKGAQILKNRAGTAPGFCISKDRSQAFFMPGVPTEMHLMFKEGVLPLLSPPKNQVACIRMRTFGMPEAQVGDRLEGLEEKHGVTIGYRASQSEIEVKVLAESSELKTATRIAEEAYQDIQNLLGDTIYTRGVSPLAQVVGELLTQKNLSLGLAESCTGGMISELITSIAGSSSYYKGGVCSYDNAVKKALLGVTSESLEKDGAVSETVARQMAQGARSLLQVDVALSVTGVAGPSGGTEAKPVGLVHFALSTPWGITAEFKKFRGERTKIQKRAALHGLWILRCALIRREESLK